MRFCERPYQAARRIDIAIFARLRHHGKNDRRPARVTFSMCKSLEGKTLLLGVGAQRAGTTWMHDYLSRSEKIETSPIKELHFFDAWLRPDLCKQFDLSFIKRLNRLTAEADEALPRPSCKTAIGRKIPWNICRGMAASAI